MPESIEIKVAPHSKEAEMMVLGCMLGSINALNIAADQLDDSDFYFTEHKTIFQTLKTAYKLEKPADVHLVCEELKRQDKLKGVGGAAYIMTLAQYAGTSAYIEEYVDLVKNKSILRKMIHASQTVEKKALDNPADVYQALDEAQNLFFTISQSTGQNSGKLLADIFNGVKSESGTPFLKELEERQLKYKEKGPEDPGITGLVTHFNDVDKMLNGFNKSNLMILAARPAMGKTALAINFAENLCFKSNLPVGIFSLEMSAEQLVHRIVCSQSEVESDKIKTGNLSGMEYQRIFGAVHQMQNQILVIDDQPGLKITDLRARARRMKEVYGIEFLVIDYLQLITGSGSFKSMENRQNEISEISRMLKNLARELNVPVLCLSQLSRKVEERTGHRPMMSDLRESGCLAGDTLIKNAETGEFYRIKDLAERGEQTPIPVFAIDENYKVGKHLMTKVFYSGQKVLYRLKTRTGRSIKASSNHPFLKLEGWTALEGLKIGDKIALPRHLQKNFETSNYNSTDTKKDQFALLAHLLGDGCILPNQPYHYTTADDENAFVVCDSAKRLFGIEPRIVSQKNWKHIYLPSPYHLTHNKKHPITNWFDQMGIRRVRSYEKNIPNCVFNSPDDLISHFLHHLWATDGNISLKILERRKPSVAIYYASSSYVLSQQVQHLLLCLDIQSSLSTITSSKGYRDMHHVNIQGRINQEKFFQSVNAGGSRGKNKASYLSLLSQIESNPNLDLIPKEAWKDIINPIRQEKAQSWRDFCQKIDISYCGSSLFKSSISRNRMSKIGEVLDDAKIHNLANSDVYWDEIVCIEKLEIEDVYDATVPGVHNFVANDILVHNSIEQDADIVMFLLRREYYDPMDKPGMAELIVGKNRHGAVGSINLTYRKEIAQFANYTPLKYSGNPVDEEAFAQFS